MVCSAIFSCDAFVLAIALTLLSSTCSADSSPRCGGGSAGCSVGSPTSTSHSEQDFSLIQRGSTLKSGVIGHVKTSLPFDDIDEAEDGAESFRRERSEDNPAFYFSLCLDMLIILIVVNGVKRFRDGDHLAPADEQPKGSSEKPQHEDVQGAVQKLHAALRKQDTASCASLIENAGPAILSGEDTWGCTALHVAADEGSAAKVALLLERRAPVRARDTWDQTPLHFAAFWQQCDLRLASQPRRSHQRY